MCGERAQPSPRRLIRLVIGVLLRTVAALALFPLLFAGCQALTGRPAGQFLDDKVLHARVKAHLAAASPRTLTRLNVNVYNGTIYLLGVIDDESEALELTRLASMEEHPVVSWLEPAASAPSASPREPRER